MTSMGQAPGSDSTKGRADVSARVRRAELRARLAAERAEFLCSLLGIDGGVLEDRPLQGTTSVAGILNAVALREESFAAALSQHQETPHVEANGEAVTDQPSDRFDQALTRCVGARTRFLDALARVADADVFADPAEPAGALSPLTMAMQCHWSDASLSLRASTWSRDYDTGVSTGPISLLRAAVRAARKDLLTTVALVPGEVRDLALFAGGRTLPEVFGLIVELERNVLGYLAQAGFIPAETDLKPAGPEDGTWDGTWAELHTVHAVLVRVLDELDPAAYTARIGPGDSAESVYMWARGCLLHDRLNGAHIRAVLELDWPERLRR